MMRWARAPEAREQMVLFVERLDEVVSADHPVRLLDEILGQLDWSEWEAAYHGQLGQPPIHPQVLASVLLYGLMTRIRSSRGLEEALQVRLDFRWLASGRSIDHTTLSEFRRKHPLPLKRLFVQVAQVARKMGLLTLQQLAFDGTRVKANNRRKGKRTVEQLQEERRELEARFEEFERQAEAEDVREQELFGGKAPHQLPPELARPERRRAKLTAALEQLKNLEEAGEKLSDRYPVTDLDARVMPNKEGGFAPNYTPTATVDVASGLIVAAEVLNRINEDSQLPGAIDAVQEAFGLEAPPAEVLADGLMATGANLAAMEERGVTLYSPCEGPDPEANPALRADPTQPVPSEQWEQLPTQTVRRDGATSQQLDKAAFVYDAKENCYWCPMGKRLGYRNTTRERSGTGFRIRDRYMAERQDCAGCPLRDRCLQGRSDQPPKNGRMINREQYETLRQEHAQRMRTPEAKAKYAQRFAVGERPFAVTKHVFGLRQFLLRGLEYVNMEWNWAMAAFNLYTLISLVRTRDGPLPAVAATP